VGCYNIRDFGAVGDGNANDAIAIQKAIDHCTSNGGGRVLVPSGFLFISGAIELKSNVELHLEYGAVLQASPNADDHCFPIEGRGYRAFITAERAENIAVTGGGTVDGGGRFYIGEDNGYIYKMAPGRPFTFYLKACSHLTFRDVTLRDGALWTLRLSGCTDGVIHGIRIFNDLKLPNNDAIDIDRCRNIRISDCHIEAGDDCICLKTTPETEAYGGACENITVTGCVLVSTSSALIIGCECKTPMRNIIFDSCVIRSSNRGLAIHLSDECDVENVLFSNMVVETRLFQETWWGNGEPIYITAIPWTSEYSIGHVRNIRFSNVLCRSENGVFIEGWQPGLIDGVLLENVRVELDKWSKWPGGRHDIRPSPEENSLPEHPTSGFLHQASFQCHSSKL
jgi:polygalacturonase